MKGEQNRWIIHADMDAFFASVEQRDFPELLGQAVVVGGNGKRGVVAAASYAARRYGVRSAMPMSEARRRCPQLIVQPVRMEVYRHVSKAIFDIFRSFTPQIEGLSVDEAFLDISASLTLLGPPSEIARLLKNQVKEQTDLTISVGVAPNKLVAKIASDMEKPDGLTIITPEELPVALDNLPVSVLPGIGPKSLPKIKAAGIQTLAHLRHADESLLSRLFGNNADKMRKRAAGIDNRRVGSDSSDKSISAESTFANDLDSQADLDRELMVLVEKVASRVRSKQWVAATLAIKIRRSDFQTYTRQSTLTPPGNDTVRLYQVAKELLHKWRCDQPRAKIRLLGVAARQFGDGEQIDLFSTNGQETNDQIDRTYDEIRNRFGTETLKRARGLKADS